MRTLKPMAAVIIFLAAAAGLFATGQQEKIPTKVVLYTSVDKKDAKKILDAFTADTGITASFVYLSSGPALTRITAEKNNPQIDAWMGAPRENHIIARDKDLTIPYKSGPWKKLDAKFKDPDGYWRSFYMNPVAFCVNTAALKKAEAPMPASWDDLLNPVYKGLIQAPTPQSFGMTAYNILASLVTMRGEDKAFEYMAKLNKNIQTYTSSGTAPSKAVAAGRCAVGIQFTPAFFRFIDQGYPLKVIFPREGVGFEAPAVSIIKGAKNLEAAKILADWLVSEKGQDVLSEKKTHFYPVNPEAKLGSGMPPFSSLKLISYNPEWAGKNKNRLVTRWVNEVLPAK